jgi:hypothetical protein
MANDPSSRAKRSESNRLLLVSINPAGSHHHPARDARALAQEPTGVGSRAHWEGDQIETKLRALIQRMSMETLWGAPRIHGELLRLPIGGQFSIFQLRYVSGQCITPGF